MDLLSRRQQQSNDLNISSSNEHHQQHQQQHHHQQQQQQQQQQRQRPRGTLRPDHLLPNDAEVRRRIEGILTGLASKHEPYQFSGPVTTARKLDDSGSMADGPKNSSPSPGFKEEMDDSGAESRNWKGICIALVVIVSICALISAAIFVLSPHLSSKLKNERLKLEDILSTGPSKFETANATWVSEVELVYRDLDGTIYLSNIATDWKTIIASNASLARFNVQKYRLSADKRYLLLVHDLRVRNSHSYTARYHIYDTKNSYSSPLEGSDGEDELQFADWGPTGSQLLVIHKNNLIYYGKVGDRPQQLTTSGREGLLYNGIPDLMNEEFVLKTNKAFWWLDNGQKLAYLTFDNTAVDQMPIVVYGAPTGYSDNISRDSYMSNLGTGLDSQSYPKVVSYPYPKPGRANPVVSVWITDLTSPMARVPRQASPPKELQATDHYVTAVTWVEEGKLAVVWSRRSQNMSLVSMCSEERNWRCDKLFSEQLASPKGWLEISSSPLFADDGSYYFMRLPVADGAAGTFPHVAMVYLEGNKRHFLTHGQFEVTKILAYRSDMHALYYVATLTGSPGTRHVYSVTDMEVPDSESRRQKKCLSCDMGPGCLYNDAKFSRDNRYMVLECLGPGIPRTELRSVDNNALLDILNTNSHLEEWMESRTLPRVRQMSIPLPGGTDEARVQLLLPLGLEEAEGKKYPLVVELDGRPGAQMVSYENRLDWGQYLASKRDYVVAYIDGRGSGFQGDKWEQRIYHHLGDLETEDVASVVKYLKDHLSYIDEDKTAIWGKGVGGYLVTSLISRSAHFHCGVAVAPVTSWRNYASAFTERYMGQPSPQDNYINYDKTDLVRNLESIKDKQFLLVHGTADRKVNVQHSMLLMKALTDKGAPFKIQIYPDGEHSLHEERYHVHRAMEDFFASCFQVEDDEDEKFVDLPVNKVIKGGKKIIGVD